MAKEYIFTVSEGEIYGDDVLEATLETLLDSAITVGVDTTEISGGEFNALQAEFSINKRFNAKITDVQFQSKFIAFNDGGEFSNDSVSAYEQKTVTLVAGAGTLPYAPVGDIFVKLTTGEIQTITPVGSDFTVGGLTTETVDVRYRTTRSIDRLQVEIGKYPGTKKLILKNKIFNSDDGQGSPIGYFITEIPKWKPMGGYELSFNSTTPVTSVMEGKALAYTDPDTGKDIYANYYIDKTISGGGITLVDLLATPDSISIAVAETSQIQTTGLRGNGLTNVSTPTGTTYVSADVGIASVSVDGLVTGVGAGTTVVTVTNGTLEDTVDVVVA